MTRSPVVRLLTVIASVASVVVAFAPDSSAAASKKVFTEALAVSDASGPVTGPLAPATTYTFDFTLANDRKSPQAFGSAQIVVPAGYTVGTLSTDVANFSAASNAVGILVTSSGPTGSGIAPGGSLTVTAAVTTPSTASCDDAWTTYVKQSNDFSGSGNDFMAASPAPTTSVGTNHLVWTTQPVTTEYDTAMAPAPVVTAENPCGNPVSGFSGAVTVTDAQGWLATGSPATASGGVATMSNLTFGDYGDTDTLTASAAGYDPVTSDPFDVVQSLVPCAAGKSCSSGKLSDTNAITIVAITADAGSSADTLTTTVKGLNHTGLAPGCDSSGETPQGAVATFDVQTRTKTVTMTLPRSYVNALPNNGTPFMDICLSLPAGSPAFTDKFGQQVTEGLLPDCTAVGNARPCVSDRRKNAGNEIVTFLLLAGDPHTSWYG